MTNYTTNIHTPTSDFTDMKLSTIKMYYEFDSFLKITTL